MDLDHYTDPKTGETFALGNVEAPVSYSWPIYGDTPTTPLIPRDQWDQYAVQGPAPWVFLPPIHYQNGVGMCNASATACGIEAARAVAGLPHVPLSGGDLYGRINGGRDQGSILEDGLREASDKGIAPVSITPYLEWRRRGPGAAAEALKYRVLEAFLCPTFAHVASALIHRFPVVVGIRWFGGYKLDSDGWLAAPLGRWGGHALCSYALAKRGREFGAATQNSWGADWGGHGGRLVIPETGFEGPVGGWWAIRAVVTEGGDIPAPRATS